MIDLRPDDALSDQEAVERFNHRYFGGRFAGIRVVRVAKVEVGAGRHAGGQWCPATRTIEILASTKSEGRNLLILHEMCHINLTEPFMHGEGFLLRMDRLAKKGVPGAAEEALHYRCGNPEILMRRNQFPLAVADALAAVAETRNSDTFDEPIKMLVAARLDLRSTEAFDRLVPDAPDRWAKAYEWAMARRERALVADASRSPLQTIRHH